MSDDSPRFTLFFSAAALFSLAAILTQFQDEVYQAPDIVHGVLVFLHVPLLLLITFLDSRMGEGGVLHMNRPLPFRMALTFAFTYLAIVIVTAWDIEIGPMDPSPPPEFDRLTRLRWFLTFSVGAAGLNYMAATKVLLPATQSLFSDLNDKRLRLVVPWVVFAGCLLGIGLIVLLRSSKVDNALFEYTEFMGQPMIVVGLIVVPTLLSLIGAALSPGKDTN